MTYTRITEYKGFPVFNILYTNKDDEERTLVSFGLKKAEGICEHIDEIRKFISGDAPQEEPKVPEDDVPF